jgi:hypothetical protein
MHNGVAHCTSALKGGWGMEPLCDPVTLDDCGRRNDLPIPPDTRATSRD